MVEPHQRYVGSGACLRVIGLLGAREPLQYGVPTGVPLLSGGRFYVHARPLVSALLPATWPVAGETRVESRFLPALAQPSMVRALAAPLHDASLTVRLVSVRLIGTLEKAQPSPGDAHC